uniref:Secreted protein n=1 Tax=Ixodes ricinus TaxID=34613 RepID=A0A147BEY3_IXORI
MQRTASSIIMKLSWLWYLRSLRILPVVKFQTSRKPSTEPVTRNWPSGEKRAHSMWALSPNLIMRASCVGKRSSSCSLRAALPRNKSRVLPGGSSPWCCCHFRAWPSRASRREGGTTLTSPDRAWAMAVRRRSLLLPPGYASWGSKYERASRFSRWMYLSGSSCFSLIMGSVCLSRDRAAPSSRSSMSSSTTCS